MNDKPGYKVGDKIVEFGQVFKIFKIKKQETLDGDRKRSIFYKPFFQDGKDPSLVHSIPLENIDKTRIRKPIDKERLRAIFKQLSQKPKEIKPIKTIKVKDKLNTNRPEKTVLILRRLWLEKSDENRNFSRSKKDAFRLSIKHLVEEVAFVLGISPSEAKERIKKALIKMDV